MTKLEAWKAWCESAGTPDLATEFTLEQSSHGKAFSFAWERGLEAILAERKRIVDLFMIQHEMAKGAHNYWKVAANLVQADVASDT